MTRYETKAPVFGRCDTDDTGGFPKIVNNVIPSMVERSAPFSTTTLPPPVPPPLVPSEHQEQNPSQNPPPSSPFADVPNATELLMNIVNMIQQQPGEYSYNNFDRNRPCRFVSSPEVIKNKPQKGTDSRRHDNDEKGNGYHTHFSEYTPLNTPQERIFQDCASI
ncbi:hypothetical protein MtrunA17_Chr4g0008991 [Medicago truncatula]|uniref:Uncharacterized protein n=1 Tax=Medicago truncatula TaxID=3880 RepID=A0A396I098_MEDTR|nr:hypothetical protein MtrunA17_Chr4g0008991 [Medicago truncatula]